MHLLPGTPATPCRPAIARCRAGHQTHRILEAAPIVAAFEVADCDLKIEPSPAETVSVAAEIGKQLLTVGRQLGAQPIAARLTAAPARRIVRSAIEAGTITATAAGADASDHLDRLMQGRTAIVHVLMAPAKEPAPRPYPSALGQYRTRFPSE